MPVSAANGSYLPWVPGTKVVKHLLPSILKFYNFEIVLMALYRVRGPLRDCMENISTMAPGYAYRYQVFVCIKSSLDAEKGSPGSGAPR